MRRFEHLMVDIETMGTDHNAAIMSIAAVEFNFDGETGQSFYQTVSLQSCLDIGLKMDADTIYWWLTQPEPARMAIASPVPLPIDVVLQDFVAWIGKREYQVWGNSPQFDLVILENAFKKCNLELPWKFYNERDVRTLVSLAPAIKALQIQLLGTAHDALKDCYAQIKYCTEIWNQLKLQKHDNGTITEGN